VRRAARRGLGLRADRPRGFGLRGFGREGRGPLGLDRIGPLVDLLKLRGGLPEGVLLTLEPGVDRGGGRGERAGLHPAPLGGGAVAGSLPGGLVPVAFCGIAVRRDAAPAEASPPERSAVAVLPGRAAVGRGPGRGIRGGDRTGAPEHAPAAGFISPNVVAAGAEDQQGDGHAFSPVLLI
jgi:hypothetical protein